MSKSCLSKFLIICLLLMAACFLTRSASAAGSRPPSYKAGFKLLLAWDTAKENGVEFILWYPGSKAETNVNLGPWDVYGGRDSTPVKRKFPLLIISHDTGANKLSYHDTARQLATAGFVVAAPTHQGDNNNDMSEIFTAEQIFRRVREIHLIVEYLKRAEYKNFVDISNIGIIGVGSGATTALILAGGLIDISGYSQYCANQENNNDLCSPWVKQRLATLSFYLPQSADDTLPGVKSLALAAPTLAMLFTRPSLAGISANVCIFDTNLQPHAQSELLRDILPTHHKFVSLGGMDARDLTAPCGNALLGEPTWQCDPEPEDSLDKRQKLFNLNLVNFFIQSNYGN